MFIRSGKSGQATVFRTEVRIRHQQVNDQGLLFRKKAVGHLGPSASRSFASGVSRGSSNTSRSFMAGKVVFGNMTG